MTDPLLMALKRVERQTGPVHPLDGVIRRMWWRSFNTCEIAKFLKVDESFVANRLAVIRDGAHHT